MLVFAIVHFSVLSEVVGHAYEIFVLDYPVLFQALLSSKLECIDLTGFW